MQYQKAVDVAGSAYWKYWQSGNYLPLAMRDIIDLLGTDDQTITTLEQTNIPQYHPGEVVLQIPTANESELSQLFLQTKTGTWHSYKRDVDRFGYVYWRWTGYNPPHKDVDQGNIKIPKA